MTALKLSRWVKKANSCLQLMLLLLCWTKPSSCPNNKAFSIDFQELSMGMLSCAEIVWFSMQVLPMQRFSARGNGPILTPAIEQCFSLQIPSSVTQHVSSPLMGYWLFSCGNTRSSMGQDSKSCTPAWGKGAREDKG